MIIEVCCHEHLITVATLDPHRCIYHLLTNLHELQILRLVRIYYNGRSSCLGLGSWAVTLLPAFTLIDLLWHLESPGLMLWLLMSRCHIRWRYSCASRSFQWLFTLRRGSFTTSFKLLRRLGTTSGPRCLCRMLYTAESLGRRHRAHFIELGS